MFGFGLLQMPDFLHIFLHRAVGGKSAAVCHVEDGHLCPAPPVPISFIHPLLDLNVGTEVRKDEEAVGAAVLSVKQIIIDVAEQLRICAERSVHQPVQKGDYIRRTVHNLRFDPPKVRK